MSRLQDSNISRPFSWILPICIRKGEKKKKSPSTIHLQKQKTNPRQQGKQISLLLGSRTLHPTMAPSSPLQHCPSSSSFFRAMLMEGTGFSCCHQSLPPTQSSESPPLFYHTLPMTSPQANRPQVKGASLLFEFSVFWTLSSFSFCLFWLPFLISLCLFTACF